MSEVRFTKAHGAGNDFIVMPDPDGASPLDAALVRALCDRRTGIGGDGVLRVAPTAGIEGFEADAAVAPWFMDYRNADGSLGAMCGNGLRVFARYLVDNGLAQPGEFAVATRAGIRTVRVPEHGDVTVDMGVPIFGDRTVRVKVDDEWLDSVNVDMGNPHAVVLVDDVAQAGPLHRAPEYEPASVYPEGVTFDFVAALEPRRLRLRAYERGVGETYSCGTGACAAVITVARRDRAPGDARYVVETLGGKLDVALHPHGRMELTGPALLVADGSWRDPGWSPRPCTATL
ncbi:MAG TPA: diaminopimelate epimerase [Actinocrinis sp.]|nr:diaminopimelate epimerase [Actinocrinis sp.]